MKAIVIEDEQLAADRLCEMIKSLPKGIEVVAQFDTIKESVDYLNKYKQEIDILFCDVQLADGISFKIFDNVEISSPVVFTTAYDEYSLRAFEVNSLDYLLKPIMPENLLKTIEKYEAIYDRSVFKLAPELLSDFLQRKHYKDRFLVKLGSKFYNKSVDEVSYFSSENKLVYLHNQEPGKKYMTDFSLEELMTRFLDPKKFFRINRQFIVHIKAVDVMKPYSGQRLALQLHAGQVDELIISREKVSQFKEWFNQ